MASLLLIRKDGSVKARCIHCRKLYAPTDRELEANEKRPNPAFLCIPCRKTLDAIDREYQRQYRRIEA